ncbi:MAG: regulatory protein RecX [Lentisphaeria bacterium]|nr:regulatory protein RecX [Lentisphaeria bacterium]
MPQPPATKTALTVAVDILARRLVSRHELRTKLAAKKLFPPGEIDAAIVTLTKMGALHDDYLASDVARSYRSRGYGPARIRMALKKRGIAPELIEQAIEGTDDAFSFSTTRDEAVDARDEDAENAFSALRRKAPQLLREPDVRKRKAKAVRFLVGRGFSYEDSIGATDRWLRENGAEEDDES